MTTQTAHGDVPVWTLGNRLDKALDHAQIKHGEMAAYLGVSRNTIGNYIAGRSPVPEAVIVAWSVRTGVREEWIRTGEGGGATPPPRSPRKRGAIPAADSPEMAALANRSRRGRASTSEYLLPTAA